MENKLKKLFEFQRFENNSQLEDLIAGTHARYGNALSDDDLEFVNAAGELEIFLNEEEENKNN